MQELEFLINQLVKTKGGTPKDYYDLLGSVAFHESAGTMNPSIRQYGGGPGRGVYQFEEGKNAGGITAARRTKRFLQSLGAKVPKWLQEAVKGNSLDATKLKKEQQDVLFLGNMIMHPKADFKKIWNGEETVPEFWANYHWAGSSAQRKKKLESFMTSLERYKEANPDAFNTTFDPEGSGYDYATATKYNIQPDASGHYPSVVPETGQILKGKKHPTYRATAKKEKQLGREIYKGDDNLYYSRKGIGELANTKVKKDNTMVFQPIITNDVMKDLPSTYVPPIDDDLEGLNQFAVGGPVDPPTKKKPPTVVYGTPEYAKAYREGLFAELPNELDEVVINSSVDYKKYPLYDSLSEDEKKYFNDNSPIGRAIRRKAYTKKSLASDAKNIAPQLIEGATEALQIPQSAMVEGIQAVRGKNYNFADALPGSNNQRRPSQFIGYKNPTGILQNVVNFGIDALTDPVDLLGAGYVGDIGKVAKAANKTDLGFARNNPISLLVDSIEKGIYKLDYKDSHPKIKKYFDEQVDFFKSEKGKDRLQGMGIVGDRYTNFIDKLEKLKLTSGPETGSLYSPGFGKMHINMFQDNSRELGDISYKSIVDHEFGHFIQDHKNSQLTGRLAQFPFRTYGDWAMSKIDIKDKTIADVPKILKDPNLSFKQFIKESDGYATKRAQPTWADVKLGELKLKKGNKIPSKLEREFSNRAQQHDYFRRGNGKYGTNVDNMTERYPFLREYRQAMVDRKYLKDKWEEITPEKVASFQRVYPKIRLNNIMNNTPANHQLIADLLNYTAGSIPIATQLPKENNKYAEGGSVNSNCGGPGQPPCKENDSLPKYLTPTKKGFKLNPYELPDTNKLEHERKWMLNWLKSPGRNKQFESLSRTQYEEDHPLKNWWYNNVPSEKEKKERILEEYNKEIKNIVLNNVETVKYKGGVDVPGNTYMSSAIGAYSPLGHYIYFPYWLEDPENTDKGAAAHETAHASRIDKFKGSKDILTNVLKNDKKYKNLNDRYLGSFSEIYARIFGIRRELDIKPDEVVTPELLLKKEKEYYKKNNIEPDYQEIKQIMEQKSLIELMNLLVQNEKHTLKQKGISPAAYGGNVSNQSPQFYRETNSYDEGGSHESNINGGIPIGTSSNGKLNTVEEGEFSYNFPKQGKFIFSNRINYEN